MGIEEDRLGETILPDREDLNLGESEQSVDMPDGLSLSLLNSLRSDLQLVHQRDRELRKARSNPNAFTASVDLNYVNADSSVGARKIADIRSRYQGLDARFSDNIRELRDWLEVRAKSHGKRVIEDRHRLAAKLPTHYQTATQLESLAQALAVVLCFRVGFPVILTQEQRGFYSPYPDYISETYEGEALKSIKQTVPPRITESKYRSFRDDMVEVEVDPGFKFKWQNWSAQPDRNRSPYTSRFEVLAQLYESRTSEGWRRWVYSQHPICLWLCHIASPADLAGIIGGDPKLRDPVLRSYVARFSAAIRKSAEKLTSDIEVSRATRLTLPITGTVIGNLDYIDWGDHVPLLAAAISEIPISDRDPFYLYLKNVLILEMDVMSWLEVFQSTLIAVSFVVLLLSFGSGALVIGALDVGLTLAGVTLAGAEYVQSYIAEDRMRLESILAEHSKDLAAFEDTRNGADAAAGLAMELLFISLFPPSKPMVNAMKNPARTLLPPLKPAKAATDAAPPPSQMKDAVTDSASPKESAFTNKRNSTDLRDTPALQKKPELAPETSIKPDHAEEAAGKATQSNQSPAETIMAPIGADDRGLSNALTERDYLYPGATFGLDLGHQGLPTPGPVDELEFQSIQFKDKSLYQSKAAGKFTKTAGRTADAADDFEWDDIFVTVETASRGTLLAARTGVTRAPKNHRGFLVDLSVVDTGVRFNGKKAFQLLYDFSQSQLTKLEIAAIRARIENMNTHLQTLTEEYGFPIRFKRPSDPHVKTNKNAYVTKEMEANRKANTQLKFDIDEVLARNLFEYPIDLASNAPVIEAEAQMELLRHVNGLFGQLDKALRDMVVASSEDTYDTLILSVDAIY